MSDEHSTHTGAGEPGAGGDIERRDDRPAYIDDPHHARQAMRLLMMALSRGWKIPPELMRTVPDEARRIVEDRTYPESYRLRAMELLARLERDNFDRVAKAAELERSEEARAPSVIQVVYVDRQRQDDPDDSGGSADGRRPDDDATPER